MTSTTLPANMIADTQDIVVDTGKPLVNAIERVAADDSNIDTDGVTSTTPVTFEVTFSEAIDASTVTAGDFVASNGTGRYRVENSDTLSTDAVAGRAIPRSLSRSRRQRTGRSRSAWSTEALSRTSPATRSCTTRAG